MCYQSGTKEVKIMFNIHQSGGGTVTLTKLPRITTMKMQMNAKHELKVTNTHVAALCFQTVNNAPTEIAEVK